MNKIQVIVCCYVLVLIYESFFSIFLLLIHFSSFAHKFSLNFQKIARIYCDSSLQQIFVLNDNDNDVEMKKKQETESEKKYKTVYSLSKFRLNPLFDFMLHVLLLLFFPHIFSTLFRCSSLVVVLLFAATCIMCFVYVRSSFSIFLPDQPIQRL